MSLPPQQRQRLQAAFLSAFPTPELLAQMLQMQLGQNLAEIAAPGSLNDQVFYLVDWAEAQGKLEALVRGAWAEAPGNDLLTAFGRELLGDAAAPAERPAVAAGALPLQQLNRLLEALLACPSMQTTAQRDEVVRSLGEIGTQVRMTGPARADALALLRTCVAYADGLDRLVAAVQLLDGNAWAALEFRAIASQVGTCLTLARLLGGAPAAAVRDWYARSVRSVPDRPEAGTRSLGELLAELMDWDVQLDDTLPLALFAEGVAAQHLNARDQAKVRAAIDAFAGSGEISPEALQRTRDQLAAELAPSAPGGSPTPGRLSPSVLVEVRETAGKPPTYTVLIHLWEPAEPPRPGGARGRTRLLQQLQSLPDLDRLRDTVSEKLGEVVRGFPPGTPEPLIEFLLPCSLLGLEVDRWPIVKDSFGDPTPLGMEFAVVLRSYERWRDTGLWAAVRQRWPRDRQASIYWLEQPKNRQLLYAELKARTDACVALGFPYGAEPSDLLVAPLRAGVPIAVWLRKPVSAPPTLRERLETLLELQQAAGWPDLLQRIRQLRLEAEIARLQAVENAGGGIAAAESLHPGLCLSVLWDDPDRFVEEPPAAQG